MGMIRDAWAYRNFIFTSVKNEFVSNFVRSRLGGVWMIIEPLVMVAIYALILSGVLQAKLPGLEGNRFGYAIYLISGIACWSLFEEIIQRCLTLFIDSADTMKKILFPKVCLPIITMGTSLVSHAMFLIAALLIFLLVGHDIPMQIFYLPLLILLTLGFSLGIGLILGVLNVFMRDIGNAIPLILKIGFWGTPIVYPVSIVPTEFKAVLKLNPMYYLVEAYHNALAFGEPLPWFPLAIIAGMAAALLGISLWMFRQANPEIVDVL